MSSVFKIFSPENCDFYYDGEFQGHITGNSDKSFRFEVQKKGTYRLKFINSTYKSELLLKLEIGADEEQDIELNFSEVNEVIIKVEAEKRRAEEAEKRRLEEERMRREAEETERKHRIEAERRRVEEAERRRRIEAELRKAKEESERPKRIASALAGASECYRFSEGLARIKKDGKYGFMDMMGNIVIPFQYDDVCKYFESEYMYDFHEGLACVCVNGKYGFIDRCGTIVIPCLYDHPSIFSDGIANVRHNFHEEFINKNGITILEVRSYEAAGRFHEGIASVGFAKYWGCIDKTGKIIIPKIYDYPIIFSEGMGHTQKDGDHIFLNLKGKIAINLHKDIDWVGGFREGLAALQRGKKWSFIDKKGKEVIQCNCDWLQGFFSEGLAMFSRNNKCGYIDKNGDEVIPCIYDYAREFSEGLALVQMNGKYGYINKQGIEVVPCTYNSGTRFSEGYAFVRTKDQKWALIDKFGNSIIAY